MNDPLNFIEQFEIGIAEIDAQHRALFVLLATLEENVGKRYAFKAARDALNKLTSYANIHFAIEESLMRIHGYPDLLAHMAEHERFRQQLTEFQRNILDADIVARLHEFIDAWLVRHIDVVDRQYVPHLLTSKIDPTAK